MPDGWTTWEWMKFNAGLLLIWLRERWLHLVLNILTLALLLRAMLAESDAATGRQALRCIAVGLIIMSELLSAIGNLRTAGALCIIAGIITFPAGSFTVAVGIAWCLMGHVVNSAVLSFIRCSRCGARRNEGHQLGPCLVCGHTDNEGLS